MNDFLRKLKSDIDCKILYNQYVKSFGGKNIYHILPLEEALSENNGSNRARAIQDNKHREILNKLNKISLR